MATKISPTDEVLARFGQEYQEYNRLSQNRTWEQQKTLRALADHANKAILDCDADDIRRFLSSLIAGGQHPNTVTKKLKQIKPFYTWAWQAKLATPERLMEVRSIEKPRGAKDPLPKPYKRKELDQFWADLDAAWPEVEPKWWKHWRSGRSKYSRVYTHVMRIQIEAIVALALHCGLRRQEIYRASIDDIHYDNEYVVVRYPKDHAGNAEFREVPHTEFSREKVRLWLELRTELAPAHDTTWLSLGLRQLESERLNPMAAQRFGELMSTIGPWELHRFRHTCGTEWLRAIGRIEIVSKMLGHTTVQQTLGYAQLVRDDVHTAMNKAEARFSAALSPPPRKEQPDVATTAAG